MKTFLTIPQKVHHGMLIVTDLAVKYAIGRSMSLEEISRKEGISQGFLEEIAARLRSGGLIKGRRGAGGGYVLTRDPAKLTVAEVITAIEGPLALVECLGEDNTCALTASCANRDICGRIQKRISGLLAEMTVAEAAGISKKSDGVTKKQSGGVRRERIIRL